MHGCITMTCTYVHTLKSISIIIMYLPLCDHPLPTYVTLLNICMQISYAREGGDLPPSPPFSFPTNIVSWNPECLLIYVPICTLHSPHIALSPLERYTHCSGHNSWSSQSQSVCTQPIIIEHMHTRSSDSIVRWYDDHQFSTNCMPASLPLIGGGALH